MANPLREPTREYRSPTTDSRRWEGFQPRAGDVVVATYPKCGTTWTQRIVDLLIHQSPEPRPIMQLYPWLDATFFAPIEADLATLDAQTHRRAIKSHLPFDSLPIYGDMKYIHVARDGRDACFSFHNHMLGMTSEAQQMIGAQVTDPRFPPPVPTPEDPREFYLNWIAEAEAGETDAFGVDLPFLEYEMTWWRERARPNVLLVHYNDMKADLEGEMGRISRFLDIDTPAARLSELARAAEFETMKSQGASLLPALSLVFDKGHERFLNKGTNGRWKAALTEEDVARYEALTLTRLTPSAAAWIQGGRRASGDPAQQPD